LLVGIGLAMTNVPRVSRVAAQEGARGARGGFSRPSISVRTTDPRAGRAVMTTVFGWRLGVRADLLGTTLFEAARIADVSGFAFIECASDQLLSADIRKNLDYNLTASEREAVLARLDELRLRVGAYRLTRWPADRFARRQSLAFAKSLGAGLVIVSAEPEAFADLDELAAALDLHIAVTPRDSAAALAALAHRSDRLGLEAAPEALPSMRGRVLALHLHDGNAERTLLELGRQQPPIAPAGYPLPPGSDGAGTKQKVRPVWITLDPGRSGDVPAALRRSTAAFDLAVRPAIRRYVDDLARLTPVSTPERVSSDQRTRIASAIARQAPATPRRSRKLLVLDLAYNGSFYHGSTPFGNLSLQLMSESTRAFTPVFSNDLDNLKYPRVTQFDAVFLNQIQGDVFDDDLAIEGLTRFVREGGGVVGLHAATWASQGVQAFGEMMGATSGAHKYNGELGALRVDDPASPLTAHFEIRRFEFFDEFYHYVPTGPYSRAKLHVLLSLDPARTDLPANQYTTRPDNDYGMVWIRGYGKGRVFNVGLGHRAEFYESRDMQQLLLAGIQFALGDLDADAAPRTDTSPQ